MNARMRMLGVFGAACLALPGCDAPSGSAPRPLTTSSAGRSESPDIDRRNPSKNAIAAGLSKLKPQSKPPDVLLAAPRFVDVAARLRLDFVYDRGAGLGLMSEGTGGGAGWLDFDRDGACDLFLVQGGNPTLAAGSQPGDVLYRNAGPFEDVTARAGCGDAAFGQGVSIADFDNDGFDDILVTNVGDDRLLHNCGDGTYQDVTGALGGRTRGWSTSSAWADVDLDGDLDLYVCRYCRFDPENPQPCRNVHGKEAMCQPRQVEALPDLMYVNLGDGRFEEQAQALGLAGPENRALGVAVADFTDDGWPDIYVGNDASPNFLFVNDGRGRFRDEALRLGCSLLLGGTAQGSMGLAVADYDRSGTLDLFISNFEGEGDSLYQNLGALGFQEVSTRVGLARSTLAGVGWGAVMADLNRDGHCDLFVVNGHIADGRGGAQPLEQSAQQFTWTGDRWVDVSNAGGPYFQQRNLGRGVAACDFDRDGDLDLAVVHQNTPLALLENASPDQHWLTVELVGTRANRRAVGTRVLLKSKAATLLQEVVGGASYCSSSEPALNFGLGGDAAPVQLEIHWPGGRVQNLEGVKVDQRLVVVEN